jgi:hypothetical protein
MGSEAPIGVPKCPWDADVEEYVVVILAAPYVSGVLCCSSQHICTMTKTAIWADRKAAGC